MGRVAGVTAGQGRVVTLGEDDEIAIKVADPDLAVARIGVDMRANGQRRVG